MENEKKELEEKKEDIKKEEKREESLQESEIIDINKPEESKESSAKDKKKRGLGGKNAPKSTDDFIAKQKKRKRNRKIITLAIIAIVIIVIVLWIKNTVNKAKDAIAGFQANNVQTAFVEQKTLYDSKDATGTLYALESRTISRSLQGSGSGGAQIESINVKVGDHVSVGDVLVEFSSENIEESIERAKEDIGTKKKLQAINAEDAQRNYVYQYENAASSMESSAKTVERALEALHEACDAYGDAKRERDEVKNMSDEDFEKKYGMQSRESVLKGFESTVATAYQAQQRAQQAYDDAVTAQSTGGQGGISSVANSLSEADSNYKKAQINSGEEVKQLQRQLNDSIDSLDDYIVYATIDGVVTEVNVSEGNTFVSGNVLTIQDDSGYEAEVLIDEYDIPKVKKAYTEKKAKGEELEVVVKTDATGDNEYKGHVILIAPTSTTTATKSASSSGSSGSASASGSSSSVNYKVTVRLDEIDDAFMIGMSAKVAIVVNKSPDNALCVPYNCVEETDDGKFIVKVMDENGDKNTADDMKPDFGNGNSGNDDKRAGGVAMGGAPGGANGIVIENNSDSDDGSKDKKKGGLFSKFSNKKDEQIETGRRYREVEVDKIFDTDYYAAIVPKVDGSIKNGDEVMIVTEKSSGNDIMAMFGPGGGF